MHVASGVEDPLATLRRELGTDGDLGAKREARDQIRRRRGAGVTGGNPRRETARDLRQRLRAGLGNVP